MKIVNLYNVKKYSSNDLVLAQVLEIEGIHYCVLMIGVRFTKIGKEYELMPEQFGAVLGLVDPKEGENVFYNLKLKRS